MPDVIDSLKRLERIGGENSKTTEKLIEAARDLSLMIAKQFVPGPDEVISVATMGALPAFTRYTVARGDARRGEAASGALYRNKTYVARNRDTALAFSRDIASGLLDLIPASLERRLTESVRALAAIESAALAAESLKSA